VVSSAVHCTVGYKWITVLDGVKFELINDIKSLYTKYDSERNSENYFNLIFNPVSL